MALLTRTPASISADEFFVMVNSPEYAHQHVELVEGDIVPMPTTNPEHSLIVGNIFGLLWLFVRQHKLGRVHVGDAGVVLERREQGRDTIRGIDIVFISYAKAPTLPQSSFLEVAPDLAVEVMSPSNTVSDTNLKIDQLLRAGCPEVWIVDPDLRRVDAHSEKGIRVCREGDMLACPDILPGFEIAISDIFPKQAANDWID